MGQEVRQLVANVTPQVALLLEAGGEVRLQQTALSIAFGQIFLSSDFSSEIFVDLCSNFRVAIFV